MIRAIAALVFVIVSAVPSFAQDNFWVQIEAHQTLTRAQDRARVFAQRLDGVHGYYLGDGFYGIFIGPYDEAGASQSLARLLRRGDVPQDSFVKNGRFFRQQFWPIGGGTVSPPESAEQPAEPEQTAETDPNAPDETVTGARASEALLTREEKRALQTALQWAGHYSAAIDGSFGGGTRRAMEEWQVFNNQQPTGVLTTGQRALLLEQYNSVLDGMNMRLVRDDASGIQMQIPTDVVAFTEYAPPFVRFEADGEISDALVLFISQAGDAGRLVGLYEVLQTLEIVPPQGQRSVNRNSFEIEGIGYGIHSYTTATLQDGEIKGFTLVWPEGDEGRRIRVLEEMQASFERLEGVLDPAIAPPDEDQAIDMVAGLSVRQPQLSRSGFFVSSNGTVVTTTEAIAECTQLTLDRDTEAEVVFADEELGIALLQPIEPLTPIGFAQFQTAIPRLQDQIAVAGYPFNGILGAPTLTFGQISDIRGLTGDDRVKRLAILPQPSDAGGAVFDDTGAVVGMLLPRTNDSSRVLPQEVNFSVDAVQIITALASIDVAGDVVETVSEISPVELTRRAADMTVLVSCW